MSTPAQMHGFFRLRTMSGNHGIVEVVALEPVYRLSWTLSFRGRTPRDSGLWSGGVYSGSMPRRASAGSRRLFWSTFRQLGMRAEDEPGVADLLGHAVPQVEQLTTHALSS